MRKGIIVVDIPEYCCRCPFEICGGDKYYCDIYETLNIAKKATPLPDRQIKPDWCPIRPMPEKKEVCGRYSQPDGVTASFKVGWNACIEEILGNKAR